MNGIKRREWRSMGSVASVIGVLVARPEIKSFIERSMVAVGTKPEHATALADNLVMADYRGHFSHGLNRLGERQQRRRKGSALAFCSRLTIVLCGCLA